MSLRNEAKTQHAVLSIVFIAIVSLSVGFVDTSEGPAVLLFANSSVIGPIEFVEIYFLAGQNSERRSPTVGEELIVKAKIRNIGPAVVHYFPTLCDTSLSVVFDSSYVRVESGRPRCLAASILTPLNPRYETTVWAPESGTAYSAIRPGSTTATVIFSYNTEVSMDPSTQAEARSTVPLTIEAGPEALQIPGFPIESLALAFVVALGIFLYGKRQAGTRARLHSD